MATVLDSKRLDSLQVVSKYVIDESNNGETGATASTPLRGLFIIPSTVAGRADDITGFVATAATELGKVQWTDPNEFGESIDLGDLGDVDLTAPANTEFLQFDGASWVNAAFPNIDLNDLGDVVITAAVANDVLTYNGTNWVDSTSVTLDTVTTTDLAHGTADTDLLGFYGATPIARPAADAATATPFATGTSGIADGTAAYNGYTVNGLVDVLQQLGIIS
jgi:hypothetical protein